MKINSVKILSSYLGECGQSDKIRYQAQNTDVYLFFPLQERPLIAAGSDETLESAELTVQANKHKHEKK